MKKTLLLLFLFTATKTFAIDNPSIGARSDAMGGTSVTFRDVSAVFNNQAGLAVLQKPTFTISAQRKFLLANVNQYAFGFAYPTKSGTFSISATQFGNVNYNEQKIGIGYGKRLLEQLDLGVQLDYFHRGITEYGSANAYTVEIGLLSSVTKTVRIGVHVLNPISIKTFGALQQELPTQFVAGISWQASKKVFFASDFINDTHHPFAAAVGMEYKFSDKFYTRIGFKTLPQQYTFGFGYAISKLKIDVSAAYHTTLGFTPQLTLSYALK